ncbi:hypothetical protein BDV59DRAFT_35445 [Aspergillus ambiguus]|uniref:WSC domain-containing protein n=1 Tax=Aspergillus ambiguus TaxID=176160 RepID=UPI003CCD3939
MKAFFLLSLLAPSVSAVAACYSSPGQLVPSWQSAYQSRSLCQQFCSKINQTVSALHNGSHCFCGSPSQLPPNSAKRPLSECQTPCPGYATDTCGGPNTWSIIIPGLQRRVDPSTESVIVTAPEPDDDGDGITHDPLASLSVNPTVVQTGIPLPTSSGGGAIDGVKTAPIPNSILTAPSEPSESSKSSTQGTPSTSSLVVTPAPTTTKTVASASVSASQSGTASPTASPSEAAGVVSAPRTGLAVGVLSAVLALLY